VEAPKPFAVRPTSRGDMPLLNSATGRCSRLSRPRQLERLIEAGCRRSSASWRSCRQVAERRRAFFRHLADVRRRGLARTTGERIPGLSSFSGPIFNRSGDVVLAISSHGLAAISIGAGRRRGDGVATNRRRFDAADRRKSQLR
jgi:DNA-binding IclR family transcriptional regulator